MQLNNNIAALMANTNIFRADRKLNLSMQRLSSGIKINSVADDPSGLAIVNKIKSQIGGMTMASRNSLDAISMVQTAEGALSECQSMLQRIRELSVQAANDSNEADDRLKMQIEIEQLLDELDSMAQKTEFNTVKLLSGAAGRVGQTKAGGASAAYLADVIYVSDTTVPGKLTYSIESMGVPAKTTGLVSEFSPIPAGVFRVNGVEVRVNAGDNANDALAKFRDACATSDINLSAPDYPAFGPLILSTKNAGADRYINLEPPGSPVLAALGLGAVEARGADAVLSDVSFIDENNVPLSHFNNSMSIKVYGNRVEVMSANNQKIVTDLKLTQRPDGNFELKNGIQVSDTGDITGGAINNLSAEISAYGPMTIQVGANKSADVQISIPNMSANALGIRDLSVKTREGASRAITKADNALSMISDMRGKLGAWQNRLEHTVSALDTANFNMEQSRSRIEDTDMAREMTTYTQLNILTQAGISILAQANQRPQQILQLIR